MSPRPAPVEHCPPRLVAAIDGWLGHWAIATEEGRTRGESDIRSVLRGCAAWERWHGVSGGNGFSLTAFDARAERWRYLFVNDTGLTLVAAAPATPPASPIDWRVTSISEPVAGQSERWRWTAGVVGRPTGETSRDSGTTWGLVFDNLYHPWRGSLPPISRHNGPCHEMHQYRALDFLVGRWEVRQIPRKRIGEVVIDSLLQGCAIRERFHGLMGNTTLRFAGFDVPTNLWRALEVSDRGEVAQSEGAVFDGGLTWRILSPTSGSGLRRTTIERTDERELRVREERSADGGQTWIAADTLVYRRLAP